MNSIEMNAVAAATAPELRNVTIPIGRLFMFMKHALDGLAGRLQATRVAEPNPGRRAGEEVIRLAPIQVVEIDHDFANATWEDAEWQ